MTSLGPKLHRALLLVCLLLLLLLVQGVKPQSGDPNGNGRSQKEEASPTGEGKEQLEEHFVASSVGEILQLLTMGHPQGEEEDLEVEMDGSTTVQDHLFDLAFCFNLASILVFL